MPAANIIEIQLVVRNCGRSASPPRRTLPYLLRASHRTNATNTVAASTNSQSTLRAVQSNAAVAADWKESVKPSPQTSTAPTRTSAGTNTPRLRPRGNTASPATGGSEGGGDGVFSSLVVTLTGLARI